MNGDFCRIVTMVVFCNEVFVGEILHLTQKNKKSGLTRLHSYRYFVNYFFHFCVAFSLYIC